MKRHPRSSKPSAVDLVEQLAAVAKAVGQGIVEADGYVIRVSVEPVRRPPTGCAAEILAVLRESAEPLATKEVLDTLARRGLTYGETGVKLTLSVLVDLGITEVIHGRGYRLVAG